jgi:two-component system response regulator HydG
LRGYCGNPSGVIFGHEKGAFTGADRRREGRFMQANKGTIFLDKIGEMSPMMQAKLLRVIESREIQRVGSDETVKADVRIVAATNRDLQEEVSAGKFREDLFYRLNVVTVKVPPLRERQDDIPILAQHFLQKYAEKNRKKVKGLTPLAMDMLLKYNWPGNVREPENAIERAVILLAGEHISEKELPLSIIQAHPRKNVVESKRPSAPIQSLGEIEKEAMMTTSFLCISSQA